jgi:tetratricopeptide (TPR) repeat protein
MPGWMRTLTVGMALTLSAPASAWGASPPPSAVASAREKFQEGMVHYRAGRYAEALAAFESAYGLNPAPGILRRIADCRERLGDLAGAQRALSEYLSTPGNPERSAVQADLDRVRRARAAAEAAEKAQLQRQAAEAAAKAERERQVVEAAAKAERERQAAEVAARAERERQAAEAATKAERERQAAEVAARADRQREAEAAAKAERERQAAEAAAQAERERQAAEAAARAERERRDRQAATATAPVASAPAATTPLPADATPSAAAAQPLPPSGAAHVGHWLLPSGLAVAGIGGLIAAHPWLDNTATSSGSGVYYPNLALGQAQKANAFVAGGITTLAVGAAMAVTGIVLQATQ